MPGDASELRASDIWSFSQMQEVTTLPPASHSWSRGRQQGPGGSRCSYQGSRGQEAAFKVHPWDGWLSSLWLPGGVSLLRWQPRCQLVLRVFHGLDESCSLWVAPTPLPCSPSPPVSPLSPELHPISDFPSALGARAGTDHLITIPGVRIWPP